MYLYIPLHTYDYPFIDDFPTFLPYPNHSKPGQCPCVANQIPSGFSSVRYGQWLIFRWFMMMYRLNKEMLAFQFATLKNQRAYPHPPMISAWARLQVSLSCEDFHERKKHDAHHPVYIYVYYTCICTYDYVWLCIYKSWMFFEELNVILNMIETCLPFFHPIQTWGNEWQLLVQVMNCESNQWHFQETHGNPYETSYGCFLY